MNSDSDRGFTSEEFLARRAANRALALKFGIPALIVMLVCIPIGIIVAGTFLVFVVQVVSYISAAISIVSTGAYLINDM